ncbi:MAG TPA: hypothetical protein VFP50_17705 [Anaeromyxobacteraceae bacterium]|nr:hypothetical protein [Anaeromyxobacteraceae bacterium]
MTATATATAAASATVTTTTQKLFTAPETWSGGAHGLSIRYAGLATDRLHAARDAMWTFPALEGCWRRHDREPSAAARLACTWGLPLDKELYGIARVPGASGIACATRVVAPVPQEPCPLCEACGHGPSGWVDLALPFGALGRAFPIGAYPDDGGLSLGLAWREAVDGWLRALAEHIHRASPFDLALVGWPDSEVLLPARPEDVFQQRSLGYLFPGERGLTWFPPTVGATVLGDEELGP